MTRAEQVANNHRLRSMSKVGFIKGYKEAEEDLALTWQDIRCIVKIELDYDLECQMNDIDCTEEEFYTEVLNRFNKDR